MFKKKWFTLVEVILVTAIGSSIIVIVYSLLDTLPKIKNFNDARQTLIQQVNDAMDRFAVIFQDYTIDYEEYYNRRQTWCTDEWWAGDDFTWTTWTGAHCDKRTKYWNGQGDSDNHFITYWETDNGNPYQPPYSYWEYKRSFWNFWVDTDGTKIWQKPGKVWDADDRDLWSWWIAIWDPDNIQELYLISHDKSRRIFLRRKFTPYPEGTNYGSSGWYTIQILKLRWFDAGNEHNFSNPNLDLWTFDWQIDTWACDVSQYFDCSWASIWDPYQKYHLSSGVNNWWVDLFDEKLNILGWNIEAYPIKDQDLAWQDESQQINPYFKITITAGLSNHLISNRNWWGTWGFTYSLENIYDTKGFYIQ